MKHPLGVALCVVLLPLTACVSSGSPSKGMAESGTRGGTSPGLVVRPGAYDYRPGQALWPSAPRFGVVLFYKGSGGSDLPWLYLIDMDKKEVVGAVRMQSLADLKARVSEVAAPAFDDGMSHVIIGEITGKGPIGPPPPPGGTGWLQFIQGLLGIASQIHEGWQQHETNFQALLPTVQTVPLTPQVTPQVTPAVRGAAPAGKK